MALIPAGEFQMGDSFNEGDLDERPVHAVSIDAFFLDRTEVTNQQYADALNWAKGQGNLITVTSGVVYRYNTGTMYPYCDTTTISSDSRITWNGTTFGVTTGKKNHPMVTVTWCGSVAYANWRSAMQGKPLCYDLSTWTCNWGSGYRLPTEAEWERAARGGASWRRFPWSDTDTIQHARANYYSSTSYAYDTSPTRYYHPAFNTGVFPFTSPVGYFAPNGYGLYDMASGVWEWCNDWYSSTYYSTTPYPHTNPHGPTGGVGRVLRGGSWGYSAFNCRCARRDINATHLNPPGTRYDGSGFRLALDSE
jgi:formylglycine-generating enzyme required for sulfatase activity